MSMSAVAIFLASQVAVMTVGGETDADGDQLDAAGAAFGIAGAGGVSFHYRTTRPMLRRYLAPLLPEFGRN